MIVVTDSAKKDVDEDYPIYFKQVKINDTELLLSFHFSEDSSFVSAIFI